MQHLKQKNKIEIFLEMGKTYVTWCQHNLNTMCS